MAPNFQSSFIPKESVGGKTGSTSDRSLIKFLGVLILILSIAASVGLFVYKGMLASELEQLKTDLTMAEATIDKPAIDKIVVFNKKLNSIKEILAKHQASSNFLTILSSTTVSKVSFSELQYSYSTLGDLDIRLRGDAASYGALALQEKELSQIKEIKDYKFSNLVLSDKGLVNFELSVNFEPSVAIYNPYIPASATTTTTTTTTTTEDNISSSLDNIDNLDDINLTDLDNI